MTGCSSSSATTAAGTSALSTRPGPTRWAGHARSPWQIMADTLVERVTGQTTATAVPVQVHLVLPDRVLLGQAEDAAELHGYGPIPRRARPRAHPRRVRAHELAAAPRHHPGYRPPRRDGLTGLGVPRRNRPADPAPRPGLPHAVVRRPGAARRPRPGPPGRWPHHRDQRARPVRVLQPRQTSGRLALPDPTRTTTRDGDHHPYRPHLPIPSPRNLASSTSTGHDRLDLVFGALLRFAA